MNRVWAISAYYNPHRENVRLANYRRFYEQLQVPLLTVELAFGEPELTSTDADRLITVRQGDILWQKERLLNLAVESLPDECEFVAWIDADVLFENEDWPADCMKELDRVPLIQLFTTASYSSAEYQSLFELPVRSLASILPEHAGDEVPSAQMKTKWNCTCGLAWAIRRDSWNRMNFYDYCIAGGGDRAFLCGALGVHEGLIAYRQMNELMAAHYRRWAASCFEEIQGAVSWIPGNVVHLPHGQHKRRNYTERHRQLTELNYDPNRDLTIGVEGAWMWTGRNNPLKTYLKTYFQERAEDTAQRSRPNASV